LIVGPLLAYGLITFITPFFLTGDVIGRTLTVFYSQPFYQTIAAILWIPGLLLLGVLAVMLVTLFLATNFTILTYRQDEGARNAKKPLWKRLYLDLWLASLGIIGYGIYLWFDNDAPISYSTKAYLVGLMSFVAPPILLLSMLLLALRMIPLLFKMSYRLSVRNKGVVGMMAFAQLSRRTPQAARIIMMMVLAISASLYLLQYIVIEQNRVQDMAKFQINADVSGSLDAESNEKFLSLLDTFRQTPGILAATPGRVSVGQYRVHQENYDTMKYIALTAADMSYYKQTADWPEQVAGGSPYALLEQLEQLRATAIREQYVPVIVDKAMAEAMQVQAGQTFEFQVIGVKNAKSITYKVVGITEGAIPGTPPKRDFLSILADYQTLNAVYKLANSMRSDLPLEQVWLKTNGDPAVAQKLTETWPTLMSQQSALEVTRTDALFTNMLGTFTMSILAALLLAFIGTLLVSWFAAARRVTNFAIFRALGMPRKQLLYILSIELIAAAVISILLGLGFGSMMMSFIPSSLAILSRIGLVTLASPEFLPLRAAYPWLPGFGLAGGMLLVCALALGVMVSKATRPSLQQTLRLNED
jgi:hypothetical protein